nr:retrotransposon protein, putative, Ty1-copia subclass [Tanacetum cinerariifolium]
MTLADDKLTLRKDNAHNGEWIDITMRKVNILLFMDDDADWKITSTKQNGVAERKNRTLIEAARTMINVDEIGINDSFKYPPDEFIHEDDSSRQYQANFYISYYVIPHGRSLTELTQEKHVLEMNAPNKQDTPHTRDVESPSDLTNIKGTQEQNVQVKQIINEPTKESLGNNIETSVPTTKPLVLEVIQTQDTSYALTNSYPVAHDRWSRDQHIELVNIIGDLEESMLTRSIYGKLEGGVE